MNTVRHFGLFDHNEVIDTILFGFRVVVYDYFDFSILISDGLDGDDLAPKHSGSFFNKQHFLDPADRNCRCALNVLNHIGNLSSCAYNYFRLRLDN